MGYLDILYMIYMGPPFLHQFDVFYQGNIFSILDK